MKPRIGLALCLAILFVGGFAASAPALEERTVEIFVGESRVVKAGFDVQKIGTGAPEVATAVKTGSREILLNATGVGETNILVWDSRDVRMEIKVSVARRETGQYSQEIRTLLGDIEGVNVRVVGGRVVVDGEVFSKKDLERVRQIVGGMPDVLNLVQMSPMLKKVVATEMEEAIGIKGVTVRPTKESFLLEGTVYTRGEAERAEKVAQAYSPDVVNVIKVMEPGTFGQSKMIQLTLNVMEIDKSALNDLGFHWNPGGSLGASGSYSGQTDQSPTLMGAIAGTISNLFPKMRKIEEEGRGRSLFQQSLMTKSGDAGAFFVGDEIPIPVAQQGGAISLEYKKVGLTLKFSPVLDAYGNVDMKVDVESSFIAGEGLGGAPRIGTTQVGTAVYTKPNESVTLAGLIGQREARTFEKAPPGGGTALVQLNNSRKFQKNLSQVLVFVTPTVLSTARDGLRDVKDRVEDSFKDYERENIKPRK